MQAMTRRGAPILLAGFLAATPAFADQFGNPTVVGKPGTLELSIGGGRSTNLGLDSDQTTATTTIGGVSNTNAVPPGTGIFKEDQAFGRLSYTFSPNVQLSVLAGSGTNTAQKSTSYGLALKLLPAQGSDDVKMGVVLRAQRVKLDTQGPFTLGFPYDAVTSGTTTTSLNSPLNGTDAVRYMQYDIFLGASSSTGTVRPYGGFALTKISGTDTISLFNGAAATCSSVGGCTTATQSAAFSSKTNISGNRMFSAVLGLDINPEGALGLTLEGRYGTQNQVTVAGSIRF